MKELDEVAEILGIEMFRTHRGDEVKYYVDGSKRYVGADECRRLAAGFAFLATTLTPPRKP